MKTTIKRHFLTVVLLALYNISFANGWIITMNSDAVEGCRAKVSEGSAHFSFMEDGEKKSASRNSNSVNSLFQDGMPLLNDKDFKNELSRSSAQENKDSDSENSDSKGYKPIRLYIASGYSRFTEQLNPFWSQGFINHREDLRSGFYISTGIGGFLSNGSFGMGVKIHYMRTAAKSSYIEVLNAVDGGLDEVRFNRSNQRNIFLLGPNFLIRNRLDRKGKALAILGLSGGPMFFSETGQVEAIGEFGNYNNKLLDDQISFAGIIELNIEISISKNLMLNAGGSYFLQYIESIDLFDTDDGIRYNLNHYNLGCGLVFAIN